MSELKVPFETVESRRLGPTLETARLVLRPQIREDFDGWAAFMADPEAARFIGGAESRPAAWRGFATMVGAWHLLGHAMFSVIERASGMWVGRVGPWQPEGWPGTEIGWGLGRWAWGKGYAVEAATASIDWAFSHLGWDEVIHGVDPANERSRAVALRLGAESRGLGRFPAPFDGSPVEFWGQTRAAWQARQR